MFKINSNDVKAPAKTNKAMIGIIIALCAVIVVGAIVIVMLLNKPDDQPAADNTSGRGTVVTEDNAEEVAAAVTEPVEDGYYQTSQTIDWHFKDGVSEDAFVENTTANTRTVYFDLIREDTNETIYSSPYIPVGESMSGLTLDEDVEPGTYETLMVYHLVDDDENELSTLSVELTIYVE